MKRVLRELFLGILTIGAVAWAAHWSWFLLGRGLGPEGIWGVREPSFSVRGPSGVVEYYHQFHFHLLTGLLGAYLPLGLLGAFWVWRWASPRRAPLP